jgi:P-type Ca2+ transporter type 2C
MSFKEPKMKATDLRDLVKLTFDNTTAADVTNEVLHVYEKKYGGVDGILAGLSVDKDKGLSSSDIESRKKIFGVNKVEEEPQDPLWKLMWEALQDPTLIFLSCAAIFSLFIAIFVERSAYGWLEGVAILFAVFVVVMVGAVNDYQKEKQFRELNAKKDDVQITVLRDGKTTKVSTFNLVVGDIVLLSTGDITPADGIVLGRNDLEINEKMLTGETVMKKKSAAYEIQGSSVKSSPVLFAGTFVQAGEGRMLIVAVGTLTYQGTMEQKMKEAEHGRSILQKKLDAMTDLITSVSMYVSIALVIILCARMAFAFHSKKCCMEVTLPVSSFHIISFIPHVGRLFGVNLCLVCLPNSGLGP